MKIVIEALGGAQIFLGISFNLPDSFEEYLTVERRCFIAMLRLTKETQPGVAIVRRRRGRIPYENEPLINPDKRKGTDQRAFDPAENNRFKTRTTVELVNEHLEEWFLSI